MVIEKRKSLAVTLTLVLIVCLAILAFLFQGSRGIWQPDEGYYTATALTMMSKDSLFTPQILI